MPRSIVHLTTFLHGGHGRAITELACAQRAAGDHVLVVSSATGTLGYQNHPHYLDRLQNGGVPLVLQDSLFERSIELADKVVAQLRELLDAYAVDVLHAHASIPAAIAVRVAANARSSRPIVVQTVHGGGTSKTPGQARRDLDLLKAVDSVIVTSAATRDLLLGAGVPSECITLIPGGISPHAPPPSATAVAIIERIRGAGQVVVGCIGSVTDNKNQALLVRALTADGARSVHAVFIGDGGETLNAWARSLGVADRVHALGYQPGAESWIGLFDALAVPSRVAGRGLVILEAFRAGVPVVASNIAPLRELVIDYDTGWLFESDDARSLATAIGRATSIRREIRDHIVDAAARKFLADYTTAVMVARHDQLYERLRKSVV
jgi:glycosyltransferase involved in cell wall biosynthesis